MHKTLIQLAGILLSAHTCFGGVALFSRPTDSILVDNNEINLYGEVTMEARILFTDQYAGFGRVFNEYRFATEDKALWFGPDAANSKSFSLAGYCAGLKSTGRPELNISEAISLNEWHHIAYVYDGREERLYLDGKVRVRRPASGTILNHVGQGAIGSNFRESREDGFVGYIDTFRIKAVAEYTTNEFSPPDGDLTSDGNTQLLYNFNDTPGSNTATDESSLHRTGKLGIGQGVRVTAPEFVGDPLCDQPSCVLTLNYVSNDPQISWNKSCCKLQVSSSVTGPYADMPEVSNPYAIDTTGAQRFFRSVKRL